MSESRYRIPRMAVAVMVLGANGCGDDDGGGGGTSEARVRSIATRECKLVATCEEDGLDFEGFDSEQECVAEYVDEYKRILGQVSQNCGERFLDFYDCYVSLGCDGDEAKCERSYQAYQDACEGMGDDT